MPVVLPPSHQKPRSIHLAMDTANATRAAIGAADISWLAQIAGNIKNRRFCPLFLIVYGQMQSNSISSRVLFSPYRQRAHYLHSPTQQTTYLLTPRSSAVAPAAAASPAAADATGLDRLRHHRRHRPRATFPRSSARRDTCILLAYVASRSSVPSRPRRGPAEAGGAASSRS